MDERELDALKRGDPKAVRDFVREQWRPTVRRCFHILRDTAEAEGVANSVLADFLAKKVQTTRTASGVLSHLRIFTSHQAISVLKRLRKGGTPTTLDEVPEQVAAPESDPAESALAGERWRALSRVNEIVRDCAKDLEFRERRAFEMYHYEGRKHDEVARELCAGAQNRHAGYQLVREARESVRLCVVRRDAAAAMLVLGRDED